MLFHSFFKSPSEKGLDYFCNLALLSEPLKVPLTWYFVFCSDQNRQGAEQALTLHPQS